MSRLVIEAARRAMAPLAGGAEVTAVPVAFADRCGREWRTAAEVRLRSRGLLSKHTTRLLGGRHAPVRG